MPYEIDYTDKWSGERTTHRYEGNEAGADAWAKGLAKDNNCKAEAYDVDRYSGKREHIVSYGDRKESR